MQTVLAAVLLFLALAARGAEPPVPQLFRGISGQEGQWRMEILEMEGRGRSVRGVLKRARTKRFRSEESRAPS